MKVKNIYKFIILLALAFFASACTHMHTDIGWAKPAEFDMSPPPGSPIYQQGFSDGCESGYSGYGNNFNKLFWKWKQDPELAQNEIYYKIWKDAYSYCAHYAMMADEHGLGNWR